MSKIKKTLFKFISELPVIGKILSDNNLRLRTSLYFGTLVNLLYVVLKVTSGILYRSLWLSFYGGYYLMLAILRVFIVERDMYAIGSLRVQVPYAPSLSKISVRRYGGKEIVYG